MNNEIIKAPDLLIEGSGAAEWLDNEFKKGNFPRSEKFQSIEAYQYKAKVSMNLTSENFFGGYEGIKKYFYFKEPYVTLDFDVYRVHISGEKLRGYFFHKVIDDGCDADEDGFGMEPKVSAFSVITEGSGFLFPFYCSGYYHYLEKSYLTYWQPYAESQGIELGTDDKNLLLSVFRMMC